MRMSVIHNIPFIKFNILLDNKIIIDMIELLKKLFDFLGCAVNFDALTNIQFDLSTRGVTVCRPAQEQDA